MLQPISRLFCSKKCKKICLFPNLENLLVVLAHAHGKIMVGVACFYLSTSCSLIGHNTDLNYIPTAKKHLKI